MSLTEFLLGKNGTGDPSNKKPVRVDDALDEVFRISAKVDAKYRTLE